MERLFVSDNKQKLEAMLFQRSFLFLLQNPTFVELIKFN